MSKLVNLNFKEIKFIDSEKTYTMSSNDFKEFCYRIISSDYEDFKEYCEKELQILVSLNKDDFMKNFSHQNIDIVEVELILDFFEIELLNIKYNTSI